MSEDLVFDLAMRYTSRRKKCEHATGAGMCLDCFVDAVVLLNAERKLRGLFPDRAEPVGTPAAEVKP